MESSAEPKKTAALPSKAAEEGREETALLYGSGMAVGISFAGETTLEDAVSRYLAARANFAATSAGWATAAGAA